MVVRGYLNPLLAMLLHEKNQTWRWLQFKGPPVSIVYPLSGDVKLIHQPEPLQQVIHGAIHSQMQYLLWLDLYSCMEDQLMLHQFKCRWKRMIGSFEP